MKKEYVEEVAARIIEQLQQGTAPWQKPWKPGELRLPYNPTTGKEYRGMNSLWLHMQGYSDPRWMTYKQASDAGAQVRLGSQHTKVVFWKFTENRKLTDDQGRPVLDENGKQKTITVQLERPRLFVAIVFNAEQIDGLPPLQPRETGPEPERNARAEAILTNSGATIQHVPGDRAFYRPSADSITLPERHQFGTADAYYATALHELGHWTGHPSRLDRDLSHPFGSEGYAREELRAEIASLMLGERLDIGHDPGQHAAYVGSWIKALKEDPKEIFRAAADAERIAGYVMGFEQEQAQLIERQPAQQANDLTAGQEREPLASQELPQAQGAPVPLAWRYAACEEFDKEMAVRMGDPNYSKARELAHALNEYDEMGFEPSPREQAILAERKPAMDEAAQWIHQNVLLNPVVKERVYETVRDLGRYTGDTDNDKELREYLGEMEGKRRAQDTRQEQQASTARADGSRPRETEREQRMSALVNTALEIADDDRDEAEAWAYEAGRFGLPMPERLTQHQELAASFQKGQRDVVQDAADAERADAIAEAGFDPAGKPAPAQAPAPVLHEKPEKPMPSRTYLAVPYKEKNEAKALGAKWDKEAKAWYAPEGVDVATSGLARWRTDAPNVVNSAEPKPPIDQFYDALRDAGLVVKQGDVPTHGDEVGKIQRVPVVGDKAGATSGAYAYHMEGHTPGGFIQNYKTGEVVHWKPEGKVAELNPEERARQAAEAAQQREQRSAERQAQYEQTAAAAAALWADAPAATADNAYCKAKGIENPGELGLRVVPETVRDGVAIMGIKIAKTAQEAKALREADPDNRVFKAGDLLIPGRDADGKLWTLQSVNPYFKSFMKGGRKHGLFTVAGADDPQKALAADPSSPLVLAEGYATANSVAQVLGKPVVVAFDSGNLDAVARELRERFPTRPMFIAADNDHNAPKQLGPDGKPRRNIGLEKAKEVAEKYGAGVVAPQFKDGEKGSDWNDYAANHGQDETRKHFAEQMAAARIEATITAERLVTLARTREMEARNDPTTSADDAEVAKERRKSAELLVSTTAQLGEVRSKTADGVLANRNATRSPAAVKAGVERSTNAMKDKAKEERQQVLNKPAETTAEADREKQKGVSTTPSKRPAKPRSRGVDAGM